MSDMKNTNDKRFKNRLYTIERIYYDRRDLCRKRIDGGYLFSGPYPTKILAEDLPEWYLYGRYYKIFGYMSTKGITDMIYNPFLYSNHFLKDDCLMISYGGKIVVKNPNGGTCFDKYDGYDERVFGGEIITILKGARKYSNYDITPFINALKEKLAWFQKEYPDDSQAKAHKQEDIDKWFATDDFDRPTRKSEIKSYIRTFLYFSKWVMDGALSFTLKDIDEIISFMRDEVRHSFLNNAQGGDYDAWYDKFTTNELKPCLIDMAMTMNK